MCWIDTSMWVNKNDKREWTYAPISTNRSSNMVDYEPLLGGSLTYKDPPVVGFQRTYKNLCWRLTNKKAHLILNVHLRAFRGYHIDHIVPIVYGFKNNINPHLIASLDNLRLIPMRDNLDKGRKLTKEAIDLLNQWGFDM